MSGFRGDATGFDAGRRAGWSGHALAVRFVRAFPSLDPSDQRLALLLYRLLARGRAVELSALAAAAGRAATDVESRLAAWPGLVRDAAGAVTGFLGLSLAQTVHRFEVNGTVLFTWCAWDALFLPRLLGATARVVSACPVTAAPMRLTVGPEAVDTADPAGAMVSFLLPEEEELRRHTTTSFCRFVHFLASAAAAREWLAQRPGAWLLNLEEAFALGRAVNEGRYPDALGLRRAPESPGAP